MALYVSGHTRRFLRSLRGPAAINENIRSRNESGIFGAEIDCELADFLDFAPAVERDFREKLFVQLWVAHQDRVHLGGERARADAVDGDFVGREFQCQSASEPEQ